MTYVSRSMSFNALVRIVALAAMLVGLLVAGAGTARAHHPLTVNEGFERSHPDLRIFHYGTGSGGSLVINQTPLPVLNPQRARSGVGHAYLWTRSVGGGSAAERTINKPRDFTSCSATAFVNPEGTRTVYFEAYDPARPWPKLVSTRIPVSGSGYQQVRMASFSADLTRVVVRVGLVGGSSNTETLRVDDLTVNCTAFH